MKNPVNVLSTVGICLGMLTIAYSCDNNYDLSKDINTEINVGSGFTIPAGQTEVIHLDRIIKPGENLTVDNSGLYQITADGDFSSSVKVIDPVKINGLDPQFESFIITIPEEAKGLNIPYFEMPQIDLSRSGSYKVNTKLPSEVKAVSKVVFSTPTGASPIPTSINLSLSELPTGINEITLTDIKIEIPEIISVQNATAGNVITFKDIVFSGSKTSESIPINIIGIDIPENLQSKYIVTGADGNKYIELQADMKITAKVSIKVNPSIITADQITLNFNYNVPSISITSVAGKLVPDVSINENLSLSDIPDFVKNDKSHFTPSDIEFNINLKNPINMDLSTNIVITPWNNTTNQSSGTPVVIPIAKIAGNKENKFVISNKAKTLTDGQVNIVQPQLTTLLDKIPDSYKITSDEIVAESSSTSQGILLGSMYTLDGNYDVTVPFRFSNLTIEYTDSIDNLLNDLKDVSDKTKQIEVTATGLSTVPTDMVFDVELYDIAGNKLNDIAIDLSQFKLAAGSETQETTSELKLTLTVPENSNQLELLEKIVYTVKASGISNQSEVVLKSTEYIQIKNIKVTIPKGVTVKL